MSTIKSAGVGRSPKVTVATRLFEPEPFAAALRLGALTRRLAEEGCAVDVLTVKTSDRTPWHARKGVTVSRFPVIRDATGAVRGYIPYLSFDIPLFFRLLTCRRPDIVVNEQPPTTGAVTRAACALRRIPYVYYVADVVSEATRSQGSHPLVTAVVTAMERWALRGAQGIISVSDEVAERVHALSGRASQVVPNGIDTSQRPSAHVDPPQGFPTGPGPVFIYAGTVASWFGPEVFVHAMDLVRDRLPDARLVFLGQGGEWDQIAGMAAEYPNIVMHPAVSPAEARQWIHCSDAAVVSLKPGVYDFAYPTKTLNALACGTPVLFAGPGPAAEDIDRDELGLAVPWDPEAVAEAMVRFSELGDDDRRRDRMRLWKWVDTHRSLRVSSARAAEIVQCAAAGWLG